MGLVTPTELVPDGAFGRAYFIGIGGAGMCGVARIMLARGMDVAGSDAKESAELSELAALGATIHTGHDAAHLDGYGSTDTLVMTSAIRESNPELAEARRRGMRVVHRAAALASLMRGRRAITVAGTHGKTTTTSMITTVLRDYGTKPGYVIGGVLASTGVGAADGGGADFVVEADESDGSFVMFCPDVAVITNIEADHLDNYGTEREYHAAFGQFARRVSAGGLLVLCADDPGTRALAQSLRGSPVTIRTYGESPQADYRLSDVQPRGMETGFTVRASTSSFGQVHAVITVGVPGRHNALNGTGAFAAAVELGVPPQRVAAALASFRGAARRLEPKGAAAGVRVLDTYAHHPTEIAADLRAARELAAGGRVIAVFQPHLFSRTRLFAPEFGAALGLADEVVVLDVYAAREDPEPGVTGELVAAEVRGARARYVPDLAAAPAAVAGIARAGDLVLTMGAGDITKLGPMVLAELAAAAAAGS